MHFRPIRSTLALATALALAGPALAAQADALAAEKRQVETDFRTDRQACDSRSGNAKDVCVEQAKARQAVAQAELDARREPGRKQAQKLARVRADAQWRVSKQRCEDMKGQAHSLCLEEAKAERARALADAKAAHGDPEDRQEAAKDRQSAQYRLELARCETLAGPAKDGCTASAKSRFGKD